MWHLVVFKNFANVFLNKLKKENSKLVKYKLKYEEFCCVIWLYAASSDETCKALTYNNFLISCCIQPKLVSTLPFSILENILLRFICMNLDTRWHIKLSWSLKVCKLWENGNSNAGA